MILKKMVKFQKIAYNLALELERRLLSLRAVLLFQKSEFSPQRPHVQLTAAC